MDPQTRINAFTLAAHRWVLLRLRAAPGLLAEAVGVLNRWRAQNPNPSRSEPYWTEWEKLLAMGIDAVELAVCADTDHAATLCSVSPLGRFMPPAEHFRLLREIREAT